MDADTVIELIPGIMIGLFFGMLVLLIFDPTQTTAESGAIAVCESNGLLLDSFEYKGYKTGYVFINCVKEQVNYFTNIGGQ